MASKYPCVLGSDRSRRSKMRVNKSRMVWSCVLMGTFLGILFFLLFPRGARAVLHRVNGSRMQTPTVTRVVFQRPMDLLFPFEMADRCEDAEWLSAHWDTNADVLFAHATCTAYRWRWLCVWLAANPHRRRATELRCVLTRRRATSTPHVVQASAPAKRAR